MKTPLFLLIKRLDRLPLYQRIDTVEQLLRHEKPRSQLLQFKKEKAA